MMQSICFVCFKSLETFHVSGGGGSVVDAAADECVWDVSGLELELEVLCVLLVGPVPRLHLVDVVAQALVLLLYRLDGVGLTVLVFFQVVNLSVLLLSAIGGVFSVLECSPSLFEFLDGLFAEPLFLQPPVEALDVEGAQLLVRHQVAQGVLLTAVVVVLRLHLLPHSLLNCWRAGWRGRGQMLVESGRGRRRGEADFGRLRFQAGCADVAVDDAVTEAVKDVVGGKACKAVFGDVAGVVTAADLVDEGELGQRRTS